MLQLIHWFRFDPRRLCVLGVWLHLLGCGLLFHAFVTGAPAGQMLAGLALSTTAALCKASGRDRFRLQRAGRRG